MTLITKSVEMRICSRNRGYWVTKGYQIPPKENDQNILVNVSDLSPNSNVKVLCSCDKCFVDFRNLLNRGTDKCRKCKMKEFKRPHLIGNRNARKLAGKPALHMRGNRWGSANRGQKRSKKWGMPDANIGAYYLKVRSISESQKLETLENHEKRGKYNYHLDHIIPIIYGFENGIPPEVIGGISNLRFIPAKENLSKNRKLVSTPQSL